MKIKLITITNISLLSLIGLFSSCRKIIDVDTPRNELISETVFSDSSNASAAIAGIYANIMNSTFDFNIGNGAIAIYTGLSSDELYATRGIAEEDEFYRNNILINPENNTNAYFWRSGYKFIYQANACIEGINKSTALSVTVKERLLAEAEFIRAYIYFNLVNLYGDVPLVTSTDFHLNASFARTPALTVYDKIVDDLEAAQEHLPADNSSFNRTRPDRFCAAALLSRICLYRSKWLEAEQAASFVINNPAFSIEPDLNSVFLPTSPETIWQLKPVDPGYNTALGTDFVPTPAGKPKYGITDNLLTAFETGDMRKASWLNEKTVNSVLYTYPYKYRLRFDGNTSPSEYFVLLRLAEQYLIRAEARARQNILDGAKADLNTIRSRSGLPPTVASSQNEILLAIQKERQIELFCEEGHRWFDLKRYGIADSVLGTIKPADWQPADQLYPVPFSEILYNPSLVQNPGY